MTVAMDTPSDQQGTSATSMNAVKTTRRGPSSTRHPASSPPGQGGARQGRSDRVKHQSDEQVHSKRSSHNAADGRYDLQPIPSDTMAHASRPPGSGWPGTPVYLQPNYSGAQPYGTSAAGMSNYPVQQSSLQPSNYQTAERLHEHSSRPVPDHGSVDEDKDDDKQLCTFFLRTGTCAYGDKCKFKHPTDRPPPQLNSRGYPLREPEPECAHYMKKGWCAFGVTCKFHHPELQLMPYAYQQPAFLQPMPGMMTVPYFMPYPQYNASVAPAAAYQSMAMQFPAHPMSATVLRPPVRMPVTAKPPSTVDKTTKAFGRMSMKSSDGLQ